MVHILLTELGEARRSCGQSQASLAAKLDVKSQMIKRLEAGVGSVPLLVEAMSVMAGGASLLSVLLPEKPEAPSFRAEPFTDQYVTRQHIRAQTGAAGLIESRHMRSLQDLIAGGRVPGFPGQDSGPGQAAFSLLRPEALREGISKPVTGGHQGP